jgi:hypothetical protein
MINYMILCTEIGMNNLFMSHGCISYSFQLLCKIGLQKVQNERVSLNLETIAINFWMTCNIKFFSK